MIDQKPFYLFEKEYCKKLTQKLASIDESACKSAFLDLKTINGRDILDVRGEVADIYITGPLSTSSSSLITLLYGGVSYQAILEALETAKNEESIKKVNLIIDSPGGVVDGVDKVAVAVKNLNKTVEARIENLCASAAYWIASQADRITAMTPAVEVGSIGVIVSYFDDSELLEREGIKEYILTSIEAPNKYKDVKSKEGRQLIIDRLNDTHNIFASRVAEGRGITAQQVNAKFGQGDLLIASKALEAGMIDAIENDFEKSSELIAPIMTENEVLAESREESGNLTSDCAIIANKIENKKVGVGRMDEEKRVLEAQATGVAEGIKAERERILNLQEWEKHNPETSAIVQEAIASGKTSTDVMPQIMAALKKTTVTLAAEESKDNEVSPATETVSPGESEEPADSEELSDKDAEIASAIAKNVVRGGNY